MLREHASVAASTASTLFNKDSPESSPHWHRHGRSASLEPMQPKQPTFNGPANCHVAFRLRQGPVLRRIGAELVQHQRKMPRGLRLQMYGGPPRRQPLLIHGPRKELIANELP